MKVAVIGSREINIKNIDKYMPTCMTMLVSGGARGIDKMAEEYADRKAIPKKIYRPDYAKFGKDAPFVRNRLIVVEADLIVAIWNGKSRGTKYTLNFARQMKKEIKVILIDENGTELMPGNFMLDCKNKQQNCHLCDFWNCCNSFTNCKKCNEICSRKNFF